MGRHKGLTAGGMGRHKGLTADAVMAMVAECGGNQSEAARRLGCSKSTVQGYVQRHGHSRPAQDHDIPVTPADGGIPLGGRQVLAQRPTSAWPARFNALAEGRGYPLESLATQYGASVSTIREKAKALKCLRYVESDSGEYVACVVHPNTPGGK